MGILCHIYLVMGWLLLDFFNEIEIHLLAFNGIYSFRNTSILQK